MPTFRERVASDVRSLSDQFSRLSWFTLILVNIVIVPLTLAFVAMALEKRTLSALWAAVFSLFAAFCTLRGLWTKLRSEDERPNT